MSDWYEKKTFANLLADAAQCWGSREALFHEGRRFSFNEAKEQVDRVARGLIGIGIGRGDKVTLWMPNRPEWIFAFFALSKIGAIVVPANTRFRSVDLGRELINAQPEADRCQLHERQVVGRELVVASGDHAGGRAPSKCRSSAPRYHVRRRVRS